MNPCPCGYLGHYSGRCACSPDRIANYRSRISAPLLDRIDLHVEVPALRASDLADSAGGETSAAVRARVAGEVERCCSPDAAAQTLLRDAVSRLSLSARSFHRVLKVARTIADLAERAGVGAGDVAEALAYRSPGRGASR